MSSHLDGKFFSVSPLVPYGPVFVQARPRGRACRDVEQSRLWVLEKVGKGLSWENWISSDVHFGKVTFFVALSREWREGQVEGRAGTWRSCVEAADAERSNEGCSSAHLMLGGTSAGPLVS